MGVLEKETLICLAENTVKSALKQGAEEAEAYSYEGHATSIGIEFGQISKTNRIIDRGLGIRVTVNKAIGFAYTNVIDNSKSLESIVEKALGAAKASKPDPDWKQFPKKRNYKNVEGTFYQKIVDLSSEDLVNVASTMLDTAIEYDKRIFPIEGGVGSGYFANAIANSNGISAFDRGTFVECSLATIAKEADAVTPICFEFNASRDYILDPVWIGKEASKLAISALKPEQVETKTTKVILTQFALQDLLSHTLIGAIKADSAQRNQTPLKEKLGSKIATEKLTIYDDGLYPNGFRTSVFDGEGTPHQTTPVIEKGVFCNFLYDNYTANKEIKDSTGNASRAGYLSTPSIDTTNFHIIPQKITPDQIISEVEDGLIVYHLQGAHSSNPVSGEFSVVATLAWKISKGEVKNSCRGAMLTGNIFDLLKNITVIGNNERQTGSLIAPWMLFENVRVIGK